MSPLVNFIRYNIFLGLENIPYINYTSATETSKKLLVNWRKRVLTPLGKIKTFILSQFTHLFTVIPSPSKEFIKELNEMFFRFIWGDKPDKIKQIFITQDDKDAGLRMVDLDKYIISLKLSWKNRIVKCKKNRLSKTF